MKGKLNGLTNNTLRKANSSRYLPIVLVFLEDSLPEWHQCTMRRSNVGPGNTTRRLTK